MFNEAQSTKLHAYVIGVGEEALSQTSYFLVANKSNLNFYYIIYLVREFVHVCVHACVHIAMALHRGQTVATGSLLPSRGSQELNSNCHVLLHFSR